MSDHGVIAISGAAAGRFIEGIVDGTPKPGTMMQIKAGVEPVNGKLTYELWDGAADGDRGTPYIVREDITQGKTVDDAYVSGTQLFMYIPETGDELQVLLENQSGTGDSFAIGDVLIVDKGTGKFLATTGTPQSEPFEVKETLAAILTDTLIHVVYTGN